MERASRALTSIARVALFILTHPLHGTARVHPLLSSIAADVKAGHSSAPTPRAEPRFRNTRKVPPSVVPKTTDGKQTGWRRIYNASYPRDASVNDATRKIFTRCDRWDASSPNWSPLATRRGSSRRTLTTPSAAFRFASRTSTCWADCQQHSYRQRTWPSVRAARFACLLGPCGSALHWILEKHVFLPFTITWTISSESSATARTVRRRWRVSGPSAIKSATHCPLRRPRAVPLARCC